MSLLAVIWCLAGAAPAWAGHQPFRCSPAVPPPPIVLPFDSASGKGFDFERLAKLQSYQLDADPGGSAFRAARYLREAIARMTGRAQEVRSGQDMSAGYVLTTREFAPPEIRNDPAVQRGLANTGEDDYNHREAFYLRTEPNRVLVVANTSDGLQHGVVALLETAGYEVLGMGPDWTYVPDYHQKELVFDVEFSDRPGFYIRGLWATSGQDRGVGTLQAVSDPEDEPVGVSYERWRIGTHQAGQSMPGFPGHSLQSYHRAVLERMKDTGSTEGFLVSQCAIGAETDRPAANAANQGELWIGSEPKVLRAWISTGTEWKEQNLLSLQANLDLSVPLVRETILQSLKQRSETFFAKNPDDVLVFGTEPEDGAGYGDFQRLARYPNWYPDYLEERHLPFGRPYVLNGFKGLNQPAEEWDGTSPGDTVFAFNNWLLREYDAWIDSLPADQRFTSTGKSKKAAIRCSLYSYNYHDVPPDFNLDPRIRVMIASYPKHRGSGKWRAFVSQQDMAQAFRIMLPREPSGDYWIISLAYYNDFGLNGIGGSHQPATLRKGIADAYAAGFRALNAETDFNFGKSGLEYYLYCKLLWNPHLTDEELAAMRDRWLLRAFGSGWREIKSYYDLMAPENDLVNAPNKWAKAVQLVQAADLRLDPAREPDAKQRLDDLKQFWYFYYLQDTGDVEAKSAAFREFLWKGQMSYMTAMHGPVRRYFQTNAVKDAAGPAWNSGPAHFTARETAAWWPKVVDHWKVVPVTNFGEGKLADETPAGKVDLNDLVSVREFDAGPADVPFYYNSGYGKTARILTVAQREKQEIGFSLVWNYKPEDNFYTEKDVAYGVELWNPIAREWESLVDKSIASVSSQKVIDKSGSPLQIATVRFPAPRRGTYRFDLGYGGNGARLTIPSFDARTGEFGAPQSLSYSGPQPALTQSPVFVYLPKGTRTLDLEVWDSANNKSLRFHSGLPATGMTVTRTVDVSALGTHVVPVNPGEDGSLVEILGNGFAFPYLYSVPSVWSKAPRALLVPRAIAVADGLTIRQ